jgi:hypothetical protein
MATIAELAVTFSEQQSQINELLKTRRLDEYDPSDMDVRRRCLYYYYLFLSCCCLKMKIFTSFL